MPEVEFHSMPDSAYLWTAMHVADEKGVAYAFVPLTYRSPEHLRLHPFGKMPVFKHGEAVLYETIAIAHYLDKAFDGPSLQPPTALGQAHMLRWISIVNAYVFPTMNRFTKERLVKPIWGIEPDEAFLASAPEALALQVSLMEAALSATAFLAGDAITLADSFLLPHLLFFGLTEESAHLLADATNLRRWLAAMCKRPSYRASPMFLAFQAMAAQRT
jgi:glutathione S-transferase